MIKRIVDVMLAVFGLLLFAPFFMVLAILIKIYDFGPVLFVQNRVGRYGRMFGMFKFRTMVVNADSMGGLITVAGDPRITPLGGLLRKSKADELPQLWNVLRGEMSFVGPRPEVRHYVDMYTSEQCGVLELIPGITDLASFAFFNEADLLAQSKDPELFYRQFLIPEKIRINRAYAARANILTDLLLMVATVLRAGGLYADLFSWLNIEPPNVRSPA